MITRSIVQGLIALKPGDRARLEHLSVFHDEFRRNQRKNDTDSAAVASKIEVGGESVGKPVTGGFVFGGQTDGPTQKAVRVAIASTGTVLAGGGGAPLKPQQSLKSSH